MLLRTKLSLLLCDIMPKLRTKPTWLFHGFHPQGPYVNRRRESWRVRHEYESMRWMEVVDNTEKVSQLE